MELKRTSKALKHDIMGQHYFIEHLKKEWKEKLWLDAVFLEEDENLWVADKNNALEIIEALEIQDYFKDFSDLI